MNDSNSIINFGDLTKPATVLIEKIADFTGAAFKPRQIRRVAKAEAEASIIKASADIEISDMQRRAMQRVLADETRNQENIENIVDKTLPQLNAEAKPEEIEYDWLATFFEKCKRVSNDEMQTLWSKVLASEANKQGSFSKRTLDIISSIDKEDAELFTQLCRFNWQFPDTHPVIFNYYDEIYDSYGLTFDSLSHLEFIGLIILNSHFINEKGFYLTDRLSANPIISYFDSSFNAEIHSLDDHSFTVGNVLLTKSGKELSSICKAEKSDEILQFVLKTWTEFGYKISSI